MIAELGLGLLWLAAGLAIIQSALGMLGLWQTHRPDLGNAVRPVAVAQALLIGLSFACLIYLFIVSDMSVKLVVANSHSDKPMLYKVSGAWGNHEGSMLLWVAVLAIAGGVRWLRVSFPWTQIKKGQLLALIALMAMTDAMASQVLITALQLDSADGFLREVGQGALGRLVGSILVLAAFVWLRRGAGPTSI